MHFLNKRSNIFALSCIERRGLDMSDWRGVLGFWAPAATRGSSNEDDISLFLVLLVELQIEIQIQIHIIQCPSVLTGPY